MSLLYTPLSTSSRSQRKLELVVALRHPTGNGLSTELSTANRIIQPYESSKNKYEKFSDLLLVEVNSTYDLSDDDQSSMNIINFDTVQ
jgi:hypothetical protein